MSDGPERPRLFVALELPAGVRHALSAWAVRRPHAPGESGTGRDVRLLDAESFHVTLCFLGSRPADEIDEIGAACRALAKRPAIPLQVAEALWLPRRRPRVLAVELSDRTGALGSLQAELAAALQRGGFYEPEDRPFLAHVTVARVARDARLRPAELPPPDPLAFTADKVVLYRSRLSPHGARYEPLETVTLARG